MIQFIHIKNFRSILDETIDFSFAEGKAPNGHSTQARLPFLTAPGTKFRGVPVLAFFGANGAGKSNLLMAVNAFRSRVIDQPLFDNDKPHYPFYQPNKLHGPLQPTEMEIVFCSAGQTFRYLLKVNNKDILDEELYAEGRTVFSIHGKTTDFTSLVRNAYPLANIQSHFQVECAPGPDGTYKRPFLAVLGKNYAGLDVRVKTAFDFFQDGIVPSITDKLDMGHFPADVRRLAQARNTDKATVLGDIAALVRKLDVPIADLAIIETKGPLQVPQVPPFYQTWSAARNADGEPVNIHLETIHRDVEGGEVRFRLNEEESAGTQNLVYLLARMLLALERGATVFVDELDRSLHPILVCSLLSLFVDRSFNKKGARLVFTTHCTDLLDNAILRLSEVAIVSNGLRTGTRVRRLTDLREDGVPLRNVTDFRKNYLDGFYSGVPFPTL